MSSSSDQPEPSTRPCKSNCTDDENEPEKVSAGDSLKSEIPGILQTVEDDFGHLVRNAISTVPGRRLRSECTRQLRGYHRGDVSFKSKLVKGVLKEFLKWYADYEDKSLVLESPESEEVFADLANSYQDSYGRRHYGRLKDIEEAAGEEADQLNTSMLSLTASTTTDDGQPRPPGDHLAEIQDTWGRFTRQELTRTMNNDLGFGRYDPEIDYDLANAIGYVLDDEPASAKWWEYVTVIEPHPGNGPARGYGHFHVGIFASHSVAEEDFHSVIDKHVNKCENAGREAHNYNHPNEKKRPISVNTVDPDQAGINRKLAEGMAWLFDEDSPEWDSIGNLGSYLCEYIGAFVDGDGDGLFDRAPHELVFYATTWATCRQRVRYSNGCHRLADKGQQMRAERGETEIRMPEPGWKAKAVEDTHTGERHPVPDGGGGVETVEILVSEDEEPPP